MRWSGGIDHSKLQRPDAQSIAWHCKDCEESVVARIPAERSDPILCPNCGAPWGRQLLLRRSQMDGRTARPDRLFRTDGTAG